MNIDDQPTDLGANSHI